MTDVYIYQARDEKDTIALAERLAPFIEPGSVLALDGDLGAGKTRFSAALARKLGVGETVNSPTFTLIKEYETGRLPVYHMDVYRISPEEADELDLDAYFFGQGLALVEWAERIEELLPADRLNIYIERMSMEGRSFRFRPMGSRYRAWCEELGKKGVLEDEDAASE